MADNDLGKQPTPADTHRPPCTLETPQGGRYGRPSGRLKTGSYSRLPLAKWPPPWSGVKRIVWAFRAGLEAAAREQYGSITARAAVLINSAALAQRTICCLDRVLRDAGIPGQPGATLTHGEWLAYTSQLARTTERRDAAVRELGLPLARGSKIIDLGMLGDDRPAAGQPEALR